jgi:thioredoxin-like negative regulator of GroEL
MEMTTADILRAEGRAEHAAEVLLRLLTHKFGAMSDEARDRIGTASMEQLDLWSERVLDAASPADVFR